MLGLVDFATPIGTVKGTSILQKFEGTQEKAYRIPRPLVFAAVVVSGLWMVVSQSEESPTMVRE